MGRHVDSPASVQLVGTGHLVGCWTQPGRQRWCACTCTRMCIVHDNVNLHVHAYKSTKKQSTACALLEILSAASFEEAGGPAGGRTGGRTSKKTETHKCIRVGAVETKEATVTCPLSTPSTSLVASGGIISSNKPPCLSCKARDSADEDLAPQLPQLQNFTFELLRQPKSDQTEHARTPKKPEPPFGPSVTDERCVQFEANTGERVQADELFEVHPGIIQAPDHP